MKSVWALMCAIGVVGSNSLVLSPIAGDVATSFPLYSASDVMMASAVYGAGTALSALVFAPKADQIGLRRALFWALLVLTSMLGLSAAAPTLWVLVAAQAVAGGAAGLALPAIYGLAAEIAPEGRESEVLGKVLNGWTLSLVAGVSLSAALADFIHWRIVFAILSVFAFIILITLNRLSIPNSANMATPTSPLTALRIHGLPTILFAVACYMIAFYGLYAFLGTHLTNRLGFTTTLAGAAVLSYGIGFGIVAPLDRLIDRYGSIRSAPIVFGILFGIYLSLGLVAYSGGGLLILCFLWGGANHLCLNILVGQLTALSPRQRATILGLYSAVTSAAMFSGTTVFKIVFEASGFAITAMLSAICLAPALAYSLLRLRILDKTTADC